MAAASPSSIRPFVPTVQAEVVVLCDPDRIAYAALGLGRLSRRRVWLDPRVWRRYAALLLRGRRLERPDPADDVLQQGGDAILDWEGRLAWVHRGRGPEDRPSVDEVIAAMRRADRPRLG